MTHYWFVQKTPHYRAKLALFAFLLAFIVIILGAYTRLTDAGLSCPDWPVCYGYLTAPHTPAQIESATQAYPLAPLDTKKAWTEMTHRYFAGTEGILILLLAFSILFPKKEKLKIAGTLLVTLLFIQITLGMLTVTQQLKPVIVLAHLLTGVSILSVLWWTYVHLRFRMDPFIKKANAHLAPWFLLALAIICIQIILGGWVSTHYAGLACIDFPYCNGQILPSLEWSHLNSDLITIHMLHRIGAFVTVIYLSVLAICLLKNSTFKPFGLLILALISLQITLGIFNIIWLRPVWVALLHQAVAILLLLTLMTSLMKVTTEHRHDFYLV